MIRREFTSDEIILYAYNEATPKLEKEISESLKTDISLKHKIDALRNSMKMLDKGILSPRKEVNEKILAYATNKKTTKVKVK